MSVRIDPSVHKFIEFVLEARESGADDDLIINELLPSRFDGSEDQFRWGLEMINTGIFRASIISSGSSYARSNLAIEDDPILSASFERHWVKLKGKDHYDRNYRPQPSKFTLINWIKGLFNTGTNDR